MYAPVKIEVGWAIGFVVSVCVCAAFNVLLVATRHTETEIVFTSTCSGSQKGDEKAACRRVTSPAPAILARLQSLVEGKTRRKIDGRATGEEKGGSSRLAVVVEL